MDGFNYIAWVDNLRQKFEDVCLEVDNIMWEEIIGVTENRLQSMGASVTKFFSDLVDDVMPQYSAVREAEEEASDFSPVQKSGVVAYRKSEMSMDDGHSEKEASFVDNFHQLYHPSCIRRRHLDPHLKRNDGGTVHEKSRMIVRGNPIKEKKNLLESWDILEKDSFTTALSSPLDDDMESFDILEKKDPFMEALSSSLDDNTESNFLIGEGEGSLSSDPCTVIGSCESEVLNIEVSLNVAVAESTGDSVDYLCNFEQETIQPSNKAESDESCIMVNSSDLCAASRDVRRSGSDKKKSRLKSILAVRKKVQDGDCDHSHLDGGWYQQNGKGLAVVDDGFSESEWEII
ncbi:hypothetical protein HS088_TW09G00378 [Tripterygium wilfordii]|uniref:Uncharacterized protein n=1 Tax=Tripterygium wilfordii TaxID=458696 RepID=A0A7J7D7N6_TRIWF|nr:uncharacterized protein LOC120005713 [Tripterygium wilfordii]KAF5742334.1 hypothetical protein HS088_TW09G00378 [Tripterygium wilfordii]